MIKNQKQSISPDKRDLLDEKAKNLIFNMLDNLAKFNARQVGIYDRVKIYSYKI